MTFNLSHSTTYLMAVANILTNTSLIMQIIVLSGKDSESY